MESLYRKYRPQTFDSMVGQKHIVTTLENAFSEGRTAHAYLFSGPRGTGKTTTARLLAKALLCESGPTPHPCGACEQCEEIAAGTHPDVYELDAASRTGVDNVREEIINRVAFAPTRGRYKIYIIDEVHMLTTAAFNALLKTLEEPPAHVVFVLCTTDPQKVPETILSRCQRLEFHRITLSDIEERLRFVCTSEGFAYDDEALRLVAKHARGGMRDALSMLEQLSVFGGGAVRLEDAQNVLGEVSDDALAHMVRAVASRDVAACFAQVADLADRGADVAQYARDLTRFVRNVYVASVAGKAGVEDAAEAEALVALAGELGGPDRLTHMLDLLGRLESDLRTSLDQRLSLEVALVRMARPAADLTLESLAVRVAELERTVADLRAHGVAAGCASSASGTAVPGENPAQPPVAAGGYGQPAGGQPAGGAGGYGQPGGARQAPPRFVPRSAAERQAQAGAPAPASGYGAPQTSQPAVARPAGGYVAPQPAATGAPQDARAGWGQPAPAPAPAQPCAPTAAQQAAAAGATSMDAGEITRQWGRVVDTMMKTNVSVGALLRTADGVLSDDGTLTVTNRGSSFAARMLMRPDSMDVLTKVASQVYGRPVRVVVAGVGAPAAGGTPAAAPRPAQPAPAQPAPAQPAASFQARPQVPVQQTPAPYPTNAGAAPYPAAPVAAAPAYPQPSAPRFAPTGQRIPVGQQPPTSQRIPTGQQAFESQQVPAAQQTSAGQRVAMPPQPSAAQQAFAARQPAAPRPTAPTSAPTPAMSPAPAQPALAQPDAPQQPAAAVPGSGFEFVPDELYDAYDDSAFADEAPLEPSPEGAAVAALSGASRQPIASPAPTGVNPASQAAAPAAPADAMTPPWQQPASSPAPVSTPASASAPTPASAPETARSASNSAPAGMDSAAIDLAQMLSAGFGGYVRVTREN